MKSLFLYANDDSFLHRLDPRPKVVFVLAMLVYIVSFEQPMYMLSALVFIICLVYALGGISPLLYWRVLALLVPLMISVTVIQGFTFHPEGTAYLFEVGPLRFSELGAVRGLSVGARLATMAVSFIMISMTTTPNDIGLALYHSGVPYRFAYLATMGLRFLPLMQEDFQTLQDARAARGDHNVGSKNPVRRMLSLPKSLFPLAATSMRESSQMAVALELRGYGNAEDRTTVDDLSLRPVDYAVVVVSLVAIVLTLYVRFVLGIGGLAL